MMNNNHKIKGLIISMTSLILCLAQTNSLTSHPSTSQTHDKVSKVTTDEIYVLYKKD